jgi:TRAP-type C4-dicarboxylate transport system substrate-binding protein
MDLRDMRISANSTTQAIALKKLGAIPVPMKITNISEAITDGKLDAISLSLSPFVAFGFNRFVTHHYLLDVAGVPLAVLMNRKTFESLPKQAQDIIRKYSGEAAAERLTTLMLPDETNALEKLKADPQRTITIPSQSDKDAAQAIFNTVIEEWAAKSPHNREVLDKAKVEIAKLRANQ